VVPVLLIYTFWVGKKVKEGEMMHRKAVSLLVAQHITNNKKLITTMKTLSYMHFPSEVLLSLWAGIKILRKYF